MIICKPTKCTGCGVCADACPKKCISFRYDEDGFYRSYVDEKLCVNCHRCQTVCPANHPNLKYPIQKAYKARRKDIQAAEKSTSGGIATALSEYIIKSGGAVAGCGFDKALSLKHSLATDLDALEGFKGSKYLQSNAQGIYLQVKEQLKEGKPVLFTGTPCQVSALRNYLGREYENLYTVDLVCHGVPSRYVLDKYIASLNREDAPVSIRFRNKAQGYCNKIACSEMQVEYPDITVSHSTKSGVYYWFSSGLSIRESCYDCPFVSSKRVGDLTLADYIGKDLDDADDQIGVNTVFVNSQKGSMLLDAIRTEIVTQQKDLSATVKRYHRLTMGSRKPGCRKSFFKDLPVCGYAELEKKYVPEKVLPSKMIRRYDAMKRRFRKLFIR